MEFFDDITAVLKVVQLTYISSEDWSSEVLFDDLTVVLKLGQLKYISPEDWSSEVICTGVSVRWTQHVIGRFPGSDLSI